LTVLGLAVALVAIKTGGLWLVARLFGMSWRPALALALLLSQGGEFGFVLFTQAREAQLIAPEAASLFSAVVTLSMATTPFLMIFARFLEYSRADKGGEELDGPEVADNTSAIVVGYGRFGQIVTQLLHAVDCSVTLIDIKPSQIELSANFDVKVYYGDGLRLDVLRMAGAADARLIMLCLDNAAMTADQVSQIRHAFPQAKIFTRVFDRRQLMAVSAAEPDGMVRETFESAVALGLMGIGALDVDDEEIADAERAVRQLDSARLSAQIDAGDMRAGSDLRFMEGGKRRPREILDQLADRLRRDA
jgi:voltage-gated potassium channel Kch